MMLPLIGRFSLGSFGFGAAAMAVGTVVARPLLVGAVTAGYETSDLLKGAWAKAKAEAESVKNEALAGRHMQGMEAELRQLREEVAQLRAASGAKKS